MKDRLLLIAFLAILVVFSLLVGRKYLLLNQPETPPSQIQQPQEPAHLREVTIYFGSPDGNYLASEVHEIEDCLVEDDCLRNTLQVLIDGPIGDLVAVVPANTVLRSLALDGDLLTIDLSRELIAGHPGGSLSELLTVYALADTMAVNFPYVRQVRILVEGEPVETIKGHVDLRNPVKADFRYTRTAEDNLQLPVRLPEAEGAPESSAPPR